MVAAFLLDELPLGPTIAELLLDELVSSLGFVPIATNNELVSLLDTFPVATVAANIEALPLPLDPVVRSSRWMSHPAGWMSWSPCSTLNPSQSPMSSRPWLLFTHVRARAPAAVASSSTVDSFNAGTGA